jgi:hypothetical protein
VLKSAATGVALNAPFKTGDGGVDFTEAELAEIDVHFGSVDHKDEQYESVWVQNPYPSDDPLDALKELPPAPEDTEEVYSEWTQRRLFEYATETPTVLTQDESEVILEELEENRKQRPRPQLASDGVPVPDGEGHFVFCLACFDNGKETVIWVCPKCGTIDCTVEIDDPLALKIYPLLQDTEAMRQGG